MLASSVKLVIVVIAKWAVRAQSAQSLPRLPHWLLLRYAYWTMTLLGMRTDDPKAFLVDMGWS